MTGLADDLLNLLRGHPLIEGVRVVEFDTPHYPNISTAPHHFHDEHGKVSVSPLKGKPMEDLKKVLAEVEKWLSRST